MQHKRLNSRNWFYHFVSNEKFNAYTSGLCNHRNGRIAVSRPSFTIREQWINNVPLWRKRAWSFEQLERPCLLVGKKTPGSCYSRFRTIYAPAQLIKPIGWFRKSDPERPFLCISLCWESAPSLALLKYLQLNIWFSNCPCDTTRIKRSNILKLLFLILLILSLSSLTLYAQQNEAESSAADSADAALEAELAKMMLEDQGSSKPVLQ